MTDEIEMTESDLDALMDRDPLSLSSQDIDTIIAYQRKQRARRAAGEKVVKDTGPRKSLSEILGKTMPVAAPAITRRS